MPNLVLLNGPPGAGKTTLAERYLVDHPLALKLDIDAIRCSIGQWETHDESKHLARALATEMARVHLRDGHDVIVPQLLTRLDYIEVLERVAMETGAAFHEMLLLPTSGEALARFRARRQAFDTASTFHPQATVEHDTHSFAGIYARLEEIARKRASTRVVDTTGLDVEGGYIMLRTCMRQMSASPLIRVHPRRAYEAAAEIAVGRADRGVAQLPYWEPQCSQALKASAAG